MNNLKDGCILANMGHSVHEIDTGSLKELKKERIRPHVSHIIWPDEKRLVLLAEVGRRHFEYKCTLLLLLIAGNFYHF